MKTKTGKKLSIESSTTFEASLSSVLQYHDCMERLGRDLRHFEKTLKTKLTEGQAIEFQVRQLLKTATKLLQLCRSNPSAPHVPHCLAAVDYFVQHEDSIQDFSNLDSFEDDAKVLETVIAKFGLKLK